jgi:hypothetical protein
MSTSKETVAALVDRIAKQLAELDAVSGEALPHQLRPPAKPDQIAQFERRRGLALPEDYKDFLLMHNGWEGFNGESALLSLEEMTAGPIFDGHRELQSELASNGQTGPSQGLVFEGSYGTQVSYFDVAKMKAGGNLDAVFWNIKEIDRQPSFTEYLESYSKTLSEMIANEREKLR